MLVNFLAKMHFEVKQMLFFGGVDTAEIINLRDRCISEQELKQLNTVNNSINIHNTGVFVCVGVI